MSIDPADAQDMAERYTAAWCSGSAEGVASFYDEDGQISINDGVPSVGREEITESLQAFFDDLPDLVVEMDSIRVAGNRAIYMWTLSATHDETGKNLRISGWESWRLSGDVEIIQSVGCFDAEEYDRQVEEGV